MKSIQQDVQELHTFMNNMGQELTPEVLATFQCHLARLRSSIKEACGKVSVSFEKKIQGGHGTEATDRFLQMHFQFKAKTLEDVSAIYDVFSTLFTVYMDDSLAGCVETDVGDGKVTYSDGLTITYSHGEMCDIKKAYLQGCKNIKSLLGLG